MFGPQSVNAIGPCGTAGGPEGSHPTMNPLTRSGRRAVAYRERLATIFAAVAALQTIGVRIAAVRHQQLGRHALVDRRRVRVHPPLIHATDVDHISVIDNSLRRFIADGRRPTSAGPAFSAGHSTVVLLVASGSGIAVTLLDESPRVAWVLGVVGLSVSGLPPFLLGLNNSAVFRAVRWARSARRADPTLNVGLDVLQPQGVAGRIFARPLRRVRRPSTSMRCGSCLVLDSTRHRRSGCSCSPVPPGGRSPAHRADGTTGAVRCGEDTRRHLQ